MKGVSITGMFILFSWALSGQNQSLLNQRIHLAFSLDHPSAEVVNSGFTESQDSEAWEIIPEGGNHSLLPVIAISLHPNRPEQADFKIELFPVFNAKRGVFSYRSVRAQGNLDAFLGYALHLKMSDLKMYQEDDMGSMTIKWDGKNWHFNGSFKIPAEDSDAIATTVYFSHPLQGKGASIQTAVLTN